VSILGYGAMELRGRPRGPEIADADAGRLLNAVLDGGINLIDTSPDYRPGRSARTPASAGGTGRPPA
jgi:aryl-alcohol dehydrogenase-like predicted oxidoreductase